MNLAKYIVLTENKKEVRFFAIGLINNDKTFTGIMHDYTGCGNYEERLVVNDKWIPDSINNEPLEWDEQVELFDSMSPYTVDQIETKMDEFIVYDTDVFNYLPQDGTMQYYGENSVLIDNMSLNVPYGLGNTCFADGYEISEVITIDEIEKIKAIKSFKNNLDNADVIRVDNSPLLESWEIFIELGDFDLISTLEKTVLGGNIGNDIVIFVVDTDEEIQECYKITPEDSFIEPYRSLIDEWGAGTLREFIIDIIDNYDLDWSKEIECIAEKAEQ